MLSLRVVFATSTTAHTTAITAMLAKTIILLASVSAALAAPFTLLPRVDLHKRCNAYNLGLPTSTGTVTSSKVITVAAGATFDGS